MAYGQNCIGIVPSPADLRPAAAEGVGGPAGGTAAPPSKPMVSVPDGPPPATLQVNDVVTGTGPEAVAGQTVSVHYVGVSYSTRQQFDASWDRGQPFSFPLGGGRVIKGWDQGVAGMRVGGRRELVIPPSLGYGDRGAGGAIKPGETLIFVVDLLSAR
jgi:peptidylprolyl isomerase